MRKVGTVLGGLALVAVLLAFTWSCADAVPPAPPQNLRIVGTGATETDSPALAPIYVTLAWDPNSEPDLAGYIVYRGSLPGFPVGPGTLLEVLGIQTEYTDYSMESDVTYVWKVTAYNDQAEESGPSNEVMYSPPVSNENTTWGRVKALYRW